MCCSLRSATSPSHAVEFLLSAIRLYYRQPVLQTPAPRRSPAACGSGYSSEEPSSAKWVCGVSQLLCAAPGPSKAVGVPDGWYN